jgi:NTE family protein
MRYRLPEYLMLTLCLLMAIGAHSQTRNAATGRKKVGVVLSGGGAKGVAHIGALKVIREAGIPIDYIAGTSMGSIVGGLSAIGYSPEQLDSIVKAQNWTYLLSDKSKRSDQSMEQRHISDTYIVSVSLNEKLKAKGAGGVIKGINLGNLFQDLTIGYHDYANFDSLPIPFACVAENVVDGNIVVFRSGVLSTAMRSSMAIPGVFTPVRLDNMVLIDGGMTDNYPVDVAREMGADIVIGVDVQNDLRPADKLTGTTDILNQLINLTGLEMYKENVAKTDLYIKVDVEGYSSASFNATALDTLTMRGEEAAHSMWTDLVELKHRIGVDSDYMATYPEIHLKRIEDQRINIGEITFSGVEDPDREWLLRKCKLSETDSVISKEQLNNAITTLRGSQAYAGVNYKLTRTDNNRYNLDFMLEEKKEKYVRLGVRFDSEEIASTIINAGLRLKTRMPSSASVTGRLGKRYMARLDYTLEPAQSRTFNFAYQFEYNDINIYDQGVKSYNTTYKYQLGEFSFSDLWFRNLRFSLGARFEYFKYKDMLYDTSMQTGFIKPEHLLSYFGSIYYNSTDNYYFPTRGADFKAGYSLYTDNFAHYKDGAPFSAVNASWSGAFSRSDRLTFIPAIYGRVLIGHNVSYSQLNFVGGNYFGRYVQQQLPFAGIDHMEMMEKSVVVVGLKARQRILANNYISLSGNILVTDDDFLSLLNHSTCRFGVSAGYAYNSIFGPLEATLGYSNQSRGASFFLNLGYYF